MICWNHARKQYRKQYFDQRHIEEIERHLNGAAGEEYAEPVVQHQLPERTRLQQVLYEFPSGLSNHDVLGRRINAINMMVALCRRREVQRRNRHQANMPRSSATAVEEINTNLSSPLCEKRQCPIYIGDEGQTLKARTFSYCHPSKMITSRIITEKFITKPTQSAVIRYIGHKE